MSCYIRPRRGGASVFFTVNLAHRGSRLLVEEILTLRAAVRQASAARPFHIDAWVVLPDHIHAVWTLPPGDSDFSTRWGSIKARFSRSLNEAARQPGDGPALPTELPVVTAGRYAGLKPGLRADKRESAIWQRRFWEHHVRDLNEYRRLVRYCWDNPVKHGYVERAIDWPYSSIHRDVRLGLVEANWAAA
ncbi:REP-associated tyrosine transposase [Roseovarius indicus]|uniref:REP-associated tyrosine transposase n=1 Tax=Roseovarius indicus TaxID=540747 RepID=UPI0032EDF2D7